MNMVHFSAYAYGSELPEGGLYVGKFGYGQHIAVLQALYLKVGCETCTIVGLPSRNNSVHCYFVFSDCLTCTYNYFQASLGYRESSLRSDGCGANGANGTFG